MPRTITDMVQQEVACCMSSMVSTLANEAGTDGMGQRNALAELAYQALELASPIADYEEAAIQAGWAAVGANGWYRNEQQGRERHANDWRDLCEGEEFAGEGVIEPYDREVLEHWAVSSWLAEKLIEQGEKVDTDFAGLNVWARTTTGQGISCDGVIERIYADTMKA